MNEYLYPLWSTLETSTPDDRGVLRPGDTLIIRLNPEFSSRPTTELILEQAKAGLPDIRVAVVIADGFAIYRPDPAKDDA